MSTLQRRGILPLILLFALVLGACSGAPVPETPTAAPRPESGAVATSAPAATLPATLTTAPTSAPTTAPTAGSTAGSTTAPTSEPTVAPTPIPTTASTPAPTIAPTNTSAAGSAGEEILFLRNATLIALDVGTSSERTLASDVREFAATPDGRLLALVRGDGPSHEIWLISRDGSNPHQLTNNKRFESNLSWSPDGIMLVYSSAKTAAVAPLDWQSWSSWCAGSEVYYLDLTSGSGAENSFGQGCDPAFAPDGRRIAYVTPPTDQPQEMDFIGENNALRLINRAGQNGWDFATAGGTEMGHLVYGPAWSPDASQVIYNRFLGYQALVDINLVELGAAFKGNGEPAGVGAGWMLPARFAPNGRLVAVPEYDFSSARGGSGYELWQVHLLRLDQASSIMMPDGELSAVASEVAQLRRATGAAWSPDGAALAAIMPAGWKPETDSQELIFENTDAGEIWSWSPEGIAGKRLARQVDYGSPLLWLPAVR